jgi:hypothetical protein
VHQKARYETDLLVEWNGEEFGNWEYWSTFNVVSGKPLAIQIDPTLDRNRVPLEFPTDSDSFPAQLLTVLVPWGLTIEPRFGQVWIVRADEFSSASDPTGVSDVFPFPGSKLAWAWERTYNYPNLDRDSYAKFGRLAPLDNLVNALSKTNELKFDLTTVGRDLDKARAIGKVDRSNVLVVGGASSPDVGWLFLRDFFATRLYQAGLQCELTGDRDRLVILPHWTTRRIASGNE